jgi:hypothetical protein
VNDSEHILALKKIVADLARASARQAVAMARRDRAIHQAAQAGVSQDAIAITANINKSRVRQILRGGPDRRDLEPPQRLGVTSLNAVYPCHPDTNVRFTPDEAMDPGTPLYKHCRVCKRPWQIDRTVLASTDRGRVDELHWTVPQLPDTSNRQEA